MDTVTRSGIEGAWGGAEFLFSKTFATLWVLCNYRNTHVQGMGDSFNQRFEIIVWGVL